MYGFDLGLGRDRFPFCHFVRAPRSLGSSSFSVPWFPFSLPRPTSPASRTRHPAGVPGHPVGSRSPSPLVARPSPRSPLAASLRISEGGPGAPIFRSSSDRRVGTSADCGAGRAVPFPDVLQPPSSPCNSWPLGERPFPCGNAPRLAVLAAQTLALSGRSGVKAGRRRGGP